MSKPNIHEQLELFEKKFEKEILAVDCIAIAPKIISRGLNPSPDDKQYGKGEDFGIMIDWRRRKNLFLKKEKTEDVCRHSKDNIKYTKNCFLLVFIETHNESQFHTLVWYKKP